MDWWLIVAIIVIPASLFALAALFLFGDPNDDLQQASEAAHDTGKALLDATGIERFTQWLNEKFERKP